MVLGNAGVENNSGNISQELKLKTSFLSRIDSARFDIEGDEVVLKEKGRRIPIVLSKGERVSSVRVDNGNNVLAVTTSQGGARQSGKLLLIEIASGEVYKTFQNGDIYAQVGQAEGAFGFFLDAMFSNNGETLYIVTSSGGNGSITLVMNLDDFSVVREIEGFALSVLPEGSVIGDASYADYEGYILVGYNHYYVTGGSKYFVNLVDPSSGEIVKPMLFELKSDESYDQEKFYDMFILK